MTRERARKIINTNFQTADELNMCVYTFFQVDLITLETHCVTGMFDNAVDAKLWRDYKVGMLNQLNVPFACYLGDTLDTCTGELIFDDCDF